MSKLVKHDLALDEHFGTNDTSRWSAFHKNIKSKGFREALKSDERADPKLKRFTAMMGRHHSMKGGVKFQSPSGQAYTIKYHPDIQRYSCSCKDWVYTKSHKLRSSSSTDCKHIQELKSQETLEKKAVSSEAEEQMWSAFFKEAQLDLLTGRMGSGKTTLSEKLAPHYDLVEQTD